MAMFIGYSTYILFALAAAFVCIAIGATLLHASNRRSDIFFVPIFTLLVLVGILDAALSQRLLDPISVATGAAGNWVSGTSKLPSKLLLATLIGTCVTAVVSWLLRVKDRPPIASRALLVCFLLFYVGSALIPAGLGEYPMFHIGLLYAPILVPALFMSMPADETRVIHAIKFGLATIVVASLLATVALPTTALQKGYHGLVPGLHTRLWGLASHANVLGPAALTFLILEWFSPWRNKAVHFGMIALGMAAVVWTQSRTTVVAAGVAFAIIATFHLVEQIRRSWAGDAQSAQVAAGFGVAAVFFVAAVAFAAMFSADFGHAISRVFDSGALGQVDTMSGRTAIWKAAIAEGVKHPVFGYGLEMWGDDYRRATGLFSAFHAHNQLLQAFSVGGGVAVLGLLVYLGALTACAFAVVRQTRGVSLALLSVLIVRAITEVPMQITAISGGDFVAHLAFVFFLATQVRKARVAAAPGPLRIETGVVPVPAT